MTQTGEAPGDLEFLRAFVNSREVDEDKDYLESPESAQAWLRESGWPIEVVLDSNDCDLLCRLREAFRMQLLVHSGHGDDRDAAEVITEIAQTAPLIVDVSEAAPRLTPAADGIASVVGQLLAAYYEANIDGMWDRLKACQKDTCQWAYYDRSKNGSRKWCTSTGCGNVMAARAYRSRQREPLVDG